MVGKNMPAKKTLNRGFTVVELLIVLAIAGVIMSIIFLAVPQLQQSSRDSQRKATVDMVRSEMEAYAANNTGVYPLNKPTTTNCTGTTKSGNFDDFYCNYIAKGTTVYKDDADPSTTKSIFGTTANQYTPKQCGNGTLNPGDPCPTGPPAVIQVTGQAEIYVHARCKGPAPVSADGKFESPWPATITQTRSYAIVLGLEHAKATFCADNS